MVRALLSIGFVASMGWNVIIWSQSVPTDAERMDRADVVYEVSE